MNQSKIGLKTILLLLLIGSMSPLPMAQAAQLNFDAEEQPEAEQTCDHSTLEPSAQLPKVNLIANQAVSDVPLGLVGTKVAQLDDCCSVGGASLCELGGVAPQGGVGGGGFPFPALAALAPVAGIPFLISGGGDDPGSPPTEQPPSTPPISPPVTPPTSPPEPPSPPPTEPVPEPSTTVGLILGLGAMGKYLRRKRQRQTAD